MRLLTMLAPPILLVASGCSQRDQSEEELINRAIDVSTHGKGSRGHIEKAFDPNVVYLPEMTCVGFNLRPGYVGGDTTVCFDKSEQRHLFTYQHGD